MGKITPKCNVTLIDYQPGDSTRYIIQVVEWPEGSGGMVGMPSDKWYTVTLFNGITGSPFEFGEHWNLSFDEIKGRMGRDVNPWTARAVALCLEELGHNIEIPDDVRNQ